MDEGRISIIWLQDKKAYNEALGFISQKSHRLYVLRKGEKWLDNIENSVDVSIRELRDYMKKIQWNPN